MSGFAPVASPPDVFFVRSRKRMLSADLGSPRRQWFAVVREYGVKAGLQLRPHDLRRTCAKLCRSAGGDLPPRFELLTKGFHVLIHCQTPLMSTLAAYSAAKRFKKHEVQLWQCSQEVKV